MAASFPRIWERSDLVAGGLHLQSCQRTLWVCDDIALDSLSAEETSLVNESAQLFSGADAYFFLLRVATGLESQVVGETDIFGQLRNAWKQAQERGLDAGIDFWIQKAFEDTKEIRTRYLEHLGGLSYGSLIRMFLKNHSLQGDSEITGPVLLLGAGQLAASVAPYLADSELWLWNRHAEKLAPMIEDLGRKPEADFSVLQSVEAEAKAWEGAHHIVVCVPLDREALRSRLASRQGGGIVLHLGCERAEAGELGLAPRTYFLDDVFELQRTQGETRSIQVRRAIRACDERAKLRGLGSSVNIAHGWEDLAVFA